MVYTPREWNVYTKTRRVINSCTTIDQLKVAFKFMLLAKRELPPRMIYLIHNVYTTRVLRVTGLI